MANVAGVVKAEEVRQEKVWNYIEPEKLTLKVIWQDWSEFLSVFIPMVALGFGAGFLTKYLLHTYSDMVFVTTETLISFIVGAVVAVLIGQTYVLVTKPERI